MTQEPAPLTVVKLGGFLALSREQLMFNTDLERRHRIEYSPATPEAWERYRAAVAGLKALEAYEETHFGGPDYGTEVPEPSRVAKIIYTETEEEWRARCAAAGLPDSVTYTRGKR